MAFLGHADIKLVNASRHTFQQVRDLSRQAESTSERLAQIAQQARQSAIPDLKLAMEEKQPALAVAMLDMLKEWVVEMRGQEEEMQRRCGELQQDVTQLQELRFAIMRTDSEREPVEIAPAVAIAKTPASPGNAKAPESPRSDRTTSTEYQPSEDGDEAASESSLSFTTESRMFSEIDSPGNTHEAAASLHRSGTLRALHGLEHVDDHLKASLAFWQDVEGALGKITQMQDHIACLVNFPTTSERLRARGHQRLSEYTSIWDSSERSWREHSAVQRIQAMQISEFIRDVEIDGNVDDDDANAAKAQWHDMFISVR